MLQRLVFDMPQKAVHKWTEKNRIVLCLLQRTYLRKFIAPIWSQVFVNQLSIEGFRNGIPATRLDGQFQEMKNGGKGYELYTMITNCTDAIINKKYSNYQREIQQAIEVLNLDMIRRSQVPMTTRTRRLSIRRSRVTRVASVPVTEVDNFSLPPENPPQTSMQRFAYLPSSSNEISNIANETVAAGRFNSQATLAIPPLLRSKLDSNGNTVPEHPLLLFRATTSINHFRSRRYAETSQDILPPPEYGSQKYRDLAWPHLERDKRYKSPFLSLAQNPRTSLRRIEIAKSEELEIKAFLAIFSFNDLSDDARQAFGKGSGPHLVRPLFAAKELSDLPDGYRGSGEWLHYGAITCDPIAILNSTDAINLAKSLRAFKAGSPAALLQISKSLSVVPHEWKEAVAINFLSRYCGKTKIPAVGSGRYSLLMDVIFNGTDASLAKLTVVHPSSDNNDIQDWQVVHDWDSEFEQEDSDEPSSQTQPLINTQTTAQPQAHDVVGKLNTLACSSIPFRSSALLQRRQASATPLWSPSPNPEPLTFHQEQFEQSRVTNLVESEEDWDMINSELEMNLIDEFPSAAKKLSRSNFQQLPHPDQAICSIEKPLVEKKSFLAQLYNAIGGPP